MKTGIARFVKRSRLLPLLAIVLLVAIPALPVQGASPFDSPPGLDRAIAAKDRHAAELLSTPGVAGAGVGTSADGSAAVVVFTETAGVGGIPASLDGVAVVTQVSGKFSALPKPDASGKPGTGLTPANRWPRPVPIGVSTGHPAITAGTIGARVKDAAGNVYALSNNHVYANENMASIGDAVIQPGTYDGGSSPADNIGTLSDFQALDFSGGSNTIDAAIASTTTLLLGNSTPSNGYGRPKGATAAAAVGMTVKKYGRTTGLTKGRIYAIHTSVNVTYDAGTALFVDQIIITPGSFSAGGDSGSLIVIDARRSATDRQPVGLLFAGSSSFTIANPIGTVLARFGVTIDGE